MNTMRLIYINLRPLPGNKIGFGKIPFRDGEMNLTLNAQGHGQYELQIVNPMNFYENVVQNVNKVLTVDSPDGVAVLGQLKADMTPKFQKALTRISAQKIPYDQLGLYPDELAEAMNAELEEKWATKGVKITSLAIELNVDEESKQRIAKFQEAKTVGSDPSMLYGQNVYQQGKRGSGKQLKRCYGRLYGHGHGRRHDGSANGRNNVSAADAAEHDESAGCTGSSTAGSSSGCTNTGCT